MDNTSNPYAAPSAEIKVDSQPINEAEQIRNEHLKQEASIKGFGSLFYLAALATGAAGFGLLLAGGSSTSGEPELNASGVMGVLTLLLIVLSVAYIWVGRGLRKLNHKIKIPATILAVLGLLNPPMGTILNGYLLYLIHNQKGKVILSPEYQDVLTATQHIKYKTPTWILVLVGIMLIAIVAAIVVGSSSP